jgi:hypothetical protein
MKKLMILYSIFLLAFTSIQAQAHFDLQLGVSPGGKPSCASLIVNRSNPYEEFQFNMVDVKPQIFAGVRANVQLAEPFFLEGGVSYTKSNTEYKVNYTYENETRPSEISMSVINHIIQFPLNVGVSLGSVDITSGLTAMKIISSDNELEQLNGFHSDDAKFQLGWQMGARYAIDRFMVGLEFQGGMNRVCEGMYVNHESLELMNVPGKFVVTGQYRF